MVYQLYKEQQLACELDEAWKFFSNPHNLSKITPKDMRFVVLTEGSGEEIYPGMEIDYTVSPLLGIPMKWKTIITEVDYQKSFTDFQKKGPYKLWNHRHELISNAGGVLMKDTVDYELPFPFLNGIVNKLIVKNKLEGIFNYRFEVLEKMFNKEKQLS